MSDYGRRSGSGAAIVLVLFILLVIILIAANGRSGYTTAPMVTEFVYRNPDFPIGQI
ncbi:hypothetical protein VQL36_02690 [Chengkuizengella sp. SCS-71B]|uniref:hypothetical protein n=1 Tax=Chengkuizengella sp. SCS-71B TaxID=3115290 RepID=UPI0032C24008